jgi:hypothetical protein
MAKWEFAIAAKDEEDLSSGHKRKKQGDIIAYKPAPWKWGKREKRDYLIVTLDNLTEDQARNMCSPMYEDGKIEDDLEKRVDFSPIAKRRFSMPIDKLAEVTSIVINKKDLEYDKEYQPLKEQLIDFKQKEVIYDKHLSSYSKEKLNDKLKTTSK